MRRLAVIMYGEKRLAELDALPAIKTEEDWDNEYEEEYHTAPVREYAHRIS